MKKKAYRYLNLLLNIILLLFGILFLWLFSIIFLYSTFKVSTPSMKPAIAPGTSVLVWKPLMGARIFNVVSSLKGEDCTVYRLPGIRKVKHNDILVFNYPYAYGLRKMQMHFKKYYVKRCIGLPGDTLSVVNGIYRVKGFDGVLGDIQNQYLLAQTPNNVLKERQVWSVFPNDSIVDWNIKDMGPLLIPSKETEIEMNYLNFLLYRKLIEWETKGKLEFDRAENCCYHNDNPLEKYHFQHDYYFMAGDYAVDSDDSRYWGVVPDDFIVGIVKRYYSSP